MKKNIKIVCLSFIVLGSIFFFRNKPNEKYSEITQSQQNKNLNLIQNRYTLKSNPNYSEKKFSRSDFSRLPKEKNQNMNNSFRNTKSDLTKNAYIEKEKYLKFIHKLGDRKTASLHRSPLPPTQMSISDQKKYSLILQRLSFTNR